MHPASSRSSRAVRRSGYRRPVQSIAPRGDTSGRAVAVVRTGHARSCERPVNGHRTSSFLDTTAVRSTPAWDLRADLDEDEDDGCGRFVKPRLRGFASSCGRGLRVHRRVSVHSPVLASRSEASRPEDGGDGGLFPFQDGRFQPGATRPVGVTEEHLLGQKTAGFLGVARGFFCGPIHDPEDEATRAV